MSDIESMATHRRRIVNVLWAVAALLTAMHVFMQWMMYAQGHDYMFGLINLFDMDGEANLPTWYSTVLLLAAACLLAWIAMRESRQGTGMQAYWYVLAIGFLCMSIDEAAMVHDLFDAPTAEVIGEDAPPALLYAWVVPYSLLVIGLGAYFLRFLWRLPTSTRIRFIIAGAVYVGGALGIEFLEGIAAIESGETGVTYAILNTVQEAMEFAGVILFIDALLRYIRARHVSVPGTGASATR